MHCNAKKKLALHIEVYLHEKIKVEGNHVYCDRNMTDINFYKK